MGLFFMILFVMGFIGKLIWQMSSRQVVKAYLANVK